MSTKLLAGRYELIEIIGHGGMAIVYKARCRLLNRYVAIKILRPEFTKDQKFVENFRKESQSAAGLSHPNIVSVYDVGQEGNIHYIVMELIDGEPLSKIISEEGRLPYKRAIGIVKQVASALSLAHKNQIIHRDVKPHNILITKEGVAKLADFGIAKAMSESTVAGGDNKVLGSVHYFSPEQARGSYIDERSDIYSLGIVFYEMLTGEVPFDGENPISVALMHINDSVPSVSTKVDGIPPQVERIISKATDKYQNNRYKSADELIDDLEGIEFVSKVFGDNQVAGGSVAIKSDYDVELQSRNTYGGRKGTEESNPDEEKEKEKKKKSFFQKGNKAGTGFIIGASVILIAVLVYFLGTMLGWFGNDAKEVIVPNFVGKTIEEANEAAKPFNLKVVAEDEIFSPDQEEGKIVSQTPTEDSKIKEGQTIKVTVSKGKKDNAVPKLEGMDYTEAEEMLTKLGFAIGTTEKVTSHLPKNTILTQSISPGSIAAKGTKIDLTISDGKGKEMVRMPNLIGKTPEVANSLLEASGLEVGTASFEERTDVEENLVVWQQYPANADVEKGVAVNYTVSKAKPEEKPPEEQPGENPGENPGETPGENEGQEPPAGGGTEGDTGTGSGGEQGGQETPGDSGDSSGGGESSGGGGR